MPANGRWDLIRRLKAKLDTEYPHWFIGSKFFFVRLTVTHHELLVTVSMATIFGSKIDLSSGNYITTEGNRNSAYL